MKYLVAALSLLAAFAAASCSSTNTGASAGVEVTNAAPPPEVSFATEPRWTYLRDRGVYVLDDDSYGYDVFRVGPNFYVYGDNNWYVSSDYRGPYVAIEDRRVPRRLLQVDDRQHRWRHHPRGWRASRSSGSY